MSEPYSTQALVDKYISTEKPLSEQEFSFLTKYIDKNSVICDVGFGSGGLLSQLLANGYSHLVGFDSSDPFVSHARTRFGDRVKIVKIDVSSDSYLGDKFDAVVAYHFITAVQEEKLRIHTISSTSRLVRDNGILITKSFWSTVDKTVKSTQENVDLNIWIPKNEEFIKNFEIHGFQYIDSIKIDKDGFPQIINVLKKTKSRI